MKIIKLLSLGFMVLFFATSCQDTLDINTDPLSASAADPNAVLPFVFTQYSNRFETELGSRMTDVPQYFQFCFNSPQQGNTSIFLTGNTWGMYYTQVLGNLALVEADAIEGGEGFSNVEAIAKIFKAKSYYELTSIWEKVPFSQALDGVNFPSPVFDDQQDILLGAVDILDEAMALIDKLPESTFDVSTGDLIYGGDMDLWRRWANSLKIRILMLVRNRDTSVDAALVAALSENVIETNAQVAQLRYPGGPGGENAFQAIITAFWGPAGNEVYTYHAPGAPFFNLLKDSGDPRFDLLIHDPNEGGPAPQAVYAGENDNLYAAISNAAIRGDLPHIMFTPAEIDFYQAELAMLGVISGDPQEHFQNGLTNILSYWGGDIPGATETIDPAVIADYVANYGDITMQDIHEQLYLEGFMRPIVGWNTVRRTNVPEMAEVPGTSISSILKRFTYPPDETASNLNTPANVLTDVPMWFEN